MPYIIAEPCINVKDRSCVDVCPVDCIYEGEDQLYIHPDECIDCGACEPECPSPRSSRRKTRLRSGSPTSPRTATCSRARARPASRSARDREQSPGVLTPGFSLQAGGSALRKSASNRLVARGCSRGAMCPAAGTT